MSDSMQGPGWWQASDGRWYPPETHPSATPSPTAPPGMAPPYGGPPGSAPSPYPIHPGMAPPYGGPPGYPPVGYPGYGAPYGMVQPTNGLATASLVCSLVGLIPFFFLLPSVAGIVLGFVSRSQIKHRVGPPQQGEGLALAGIIIGFVSVAFWVVLFVGLGIFASHFHCVTNNQGTSRCTSN